MKEIFTMEEFEEEEVDEPDNIAAKFARRPCLTVCISCGLVGYGIFNIVFDWLWVDDMLKAQEGLVFGPPSSQIVGTMIFIASIGTLTFLMEIANTIWKVVRGNVVVHEDLSQILSLFLEEVPSVTLNFLLASCREVPVSYYQMVKAALAMVGAAIRCLKVAIKFLTVRRRTDSPKGFIPFIIRCVILAACAYLMAASILTWIYTYSPDASEDSSGIKVPPNLYTKSYDSAKYLYKSGYFFSHPWYNSCNRNNHSWNNGPNLNWMKLESLMDIENSEEQDMTVHFSYNDSVSVITTVMDGEWECFKTEMPSCEIEKLSNCNVTTPESFEAFDFKFVSIEYTKTLVFGDIKFKGIISNSSYCEEVKVDDVGFISVGDNRIVGQLQYFKTKQHVNDTYIFSLGNDGGYKYYRYGADLFNVSDVWKTGYDRCDMTGSLRPNYGSKIDVAC